MARRWRVTVRHASEVSREKAGSLADALEKARAATATTIAEGGLGPINALRDFEPGQRVQARIEIDGPGMVGGPKGGIDVMGDGSVVAYTGSIRKESLESRGTLDGAIEALRQALT